MSASATATWNVSAGSTVVDLFDFLVNSNVLVDCTPAHYVRIDNDGAGTLRVGVTSQVNTSGGHLIGPGECFEMRVPTGNRIGLVGASGNAAAAITATVMIGD